MRNVDVCAVLALWGGRLWKVAVHLRMLSLAVDQESVEGIQSWRAIAAGMIKGEDHRKEMAESLAEGQYCIKEGRNNLPNLEQALEALANDDDRR